MAGSLIDASIRRAALVAESRGFIVPDSTPVLDDTPQIIIEPEDNDEIFLEFNDGLGYSTDKNSYRGYGFKFTWVHEGKYMGGDKPVSITDDLDPDTITNPLDGGEIPVFNEQTGKYESRPVKGATCWTIQRPTDRTYTFFLNLPFDVEITNTFESIEAGPATVDFPSGVIAAGDPLEFDVSGTDGTSSFLTVQVTYNCKLGT